jgi:hypothetical protein
MQEQTVSSQGSRESSSGDSECQSVPGEAEPMVEIFVALPESLYLQLQEEVEAGCMSSEALVCAALTGYLAALHVWRNPEFQSELWAVDSLLGLLTQRPNRSALASFSNQS